MTPADRLRDEVASFCVPVHTYFERDSQGNRQTGSSLRNVIETLNEADDLRDEVRNWDRLYNSMATFVEAAPVTGQVSTLYHGCYLKDRSCARALLMVTADVATYYVLVPAKYASSLGKTTYIAVTAIGATANAVEGGLLAGDAYDAAQAGNNLQSVFLAGSAVLRFTAAAGLVIGNVEGVVARGNNIVTPDATKLAATDSERNAIARAFIEGEDLDALQYYQGSGYHAINDYFRTGGRGLPAPRLAHVQKHAESLRALYEKQAPIGQVATVYRGSGVPAGMAPVPGEIFEAKGFLSTSFNANVARSFASNGFQGNLATMIVEIEIPATARGIAMNALGTRSFFPQESEFLMANGARFKVLSSNPGILNNKPFYHQRWLLVSDGVGAGPVPAYRDVAEYSGLGVAYSKFFSFFGDDFRKVAP